jgi:hypothetical protein
MAWTDAYLQQLDLAAGRLCLTAELVQGSEMDGTKALEMLKAHMTAISLKFAEQWDLRQPSMSGHGDTLFRAYYVDLENPVTDRSRLTAYPKIVGTLTSWESYSNGPDVEEEWRQVRDRDGFELAIKRVAPHRWGRNDDYDDSHSQVLFRKWYTPVTR